MIQTEATPDTDTKFEREKTVCDLAKTKPKKFWKSIKNKYKKKSSESNNLTAENLLDHFNSVYGGTDEPSQQQEPDLDSVTDSELDSEITETEIKNAVFSQKNNKSSGTDNLCADFF